MTKVVRPIVLSEVCLLKVIKKKFTDEEIILHKLALYKYSDRINNGWNMIIYE